MKKSMLVSLIVMTSFVIGCEDKEVTLARINADKEIAVAKEMSKTKPIVQQYEPVNTLPQQVLPQPQVVGSVPSVVVAPQQSSSVGTHIALGALAGTAGYLAGKTLTEKKNAPTVISKPYVVRRPTSSYSRVVRIRRK